MTLEKLTENIQKLIPTGDFKSIHSLFFDFVYHQIESKKPECSDWQKIRDLFLSDSENQTLALQILEGQGFGAFKQQIVAIYSGDFFKYFQERLEWVATTISEKKAIQENYQKLKLELKNINHSLSLKASNEKEKKLKETQKKEIEERIYEYEERMFQPSGEINSSEEGMKHVKNTLQYFFKQNTIHNQPLSFYMFLFICNHATTP